jgi:hypothetical protein
VIAQTIVDGRRRRVLPSELADDALSGALWRIAVATQTRIGFEAIEFVRQGQLKSVPPFAVSSRDEALTGRVGCKSALRSANWLGFRGCPTESCVE